MTALILTKRDDAILTVTLNAPERRNPISDIEMVDALTATMKAADTDPEIKAVILTGAGKAFSSGGDVKKMVPGAGLRDAMPANTRSNYREGIQRLPLLFQSLDVPVIAAINGPAIGAGCDLACMCDVRIASDNAVFAESFVKIGLIPGDGGAWLLPRIVGFSKACELSLTGETIDAQEALHIGLVSRVVPLEDLLSIAREVADKIAANSRPSTRMTKRLLREGQTATLPSLLELSAALQSLVHATVEHDEAVQAFIKRSK
nr:crotonase/enoyl-CoA hydratase family protein [Sphingomonas sp. CDS-1]